MLCDTGPWLDWKQRFSQYRVDQAYQGGLDSLGQCIDYSMGLETGPSLSCSPNLKFPFSMQQACKIVEAFIGQLYELAENCDFGAQKEEHLRERTAIGICNKGLQMKDGKENGKMERKEGI